MGSGDYSRGATRHLLAKSLCCSFGLEQLHVADGSSVIDPGLVRALTGQNLTALFAPQLGDLRFAGKRVVQHFSRAVVSYFFCVGDAYVKYD